jgi:hypothetical protein
MTGDEHFAGAESSVNAIESIFREGFFDYLIG